MISHRSCTNGNSTVTGGSPTWNHSLSFPSWTMSSNRSRRWPKFRSTHTMLCPNATGSCCTASLNVCLSGRPRGSAETNSVAALASSILVKLVMTYWTQILIMCGKHIIRRSRGSKLMSHDWRSFASSSMKVPLLDALLRVQWPPCSRSSVLHS